MHPYDEPYWLCEPHHYRADDQQTEDPDFCGSRYHLVHLGHRHHRLYQHTSGLPESHLSGATRRIRCIRLAVNCRVHCPSPGGRCRCSFYLGSECYLHGCNLFLQSYHLSAKSEFWSRLMNYQYL